MKTNLYGVTLGAACSAMLIFGSNTAFATEYSLTEKIKVDLKAEMTNIAKSTYAASFAHPDGSAVTKHVAVYEGTGDPRNSLARSDSEKFNSIPSKPLKDLWSLPSRLLELDNYTEVEFTVSTDFGGEADFVAKGKFTSILSDSGKHEGSTHSSQFWLNNTLTVGIRTTSYGLFEIGGIDNVFDTVLSPVPVVHSFVNQEVNSVPTQIITTRTVRNNIFGISWNYSLNDILFLGATLKPTSGLKGFDQETAENFIEHGFAAELRLGGPELMARIGAAYMSDFPHAFAELGFYESIINSSKIIGVNIGFEFPGWKVGGSYKYRGSKSVVTETFTYHDNVTAPEQRVKVDNFYFHQIEAGLTFHPGKTDWVESEEFKNWSLGAKFTIMFDSSDPSFVNFKADQVSDKIGVDGKDLILGIKKRPVAFQLDLSAKRDFGDSFSVFGGLRFTFDQGVGMWDFYRFTTKDDALKLKEGKDLKRLRPLNYLNMVLYVGVTAGLR